MPQTLTRPLFSIAILTVFGCGDPQTATAPSQQESPTVIVSPPATSSPSVSTPSNQSPPQQSPPQQSPPQQSPARQSPSESLPAWLSPDVTQLAQRGITRHASDRIILYSDLPPDEVAPLPPLVDQFVRIVDEFLGPPPATLINDSRPLVGYLMADQQKFEGLKLIPERIPQHHSGWHLDRVIWMQSQKQSYYQRHLLFHEVVHASLNSRVARGLPAWLEEGLAELLATHRLVENTVFWAGIPESDRELDGWGRIEHIREHLKADPPLSPDDIAAFTGDKYETQRAYAWSWALCFYLARHPQHAQPFRTWLHGRLSDNTPSALPWHDWEPKRRAEWDLFLEELDYGLDLETWAVNFDSPPSTDSLENFPVTSTRGWQSSGLTVKAEQSRELNITGEISLDKTLPNWTSTPSGISIRYAAGHPLGLILGRILVTDPDGNQRFSPISPLGRLDAWKPISSGELYLRINDRYADLANNTGDYRVTISLPK